MLSIEDDSRFESDRVSYMFRCASTYNWDVLNGYCSASLITLYSSLPLHRIGLVENYDDGIENYNHLICRNRKEKVPSSLHKQLLFCDQWGNTVLHQACFSKPPVDVVEMLLEIGRHTSPPVLDLASIPSRDGSTALLVACGTGADIGVIEALLKPPQSPASSHPSHPDIHLVTRLAHSRHVWLPLIPDHQGSTPLSELCNQYHISRTNTKPVSPILSLVSSPEQLLQFQPLRLFLDKVHLLLKAATKMNTTDDHDHDHDACFKLDDQEDDAFFLLYSLASFSHTVPLLLSSLICRLYPQSLSQRHCYSGQLPLHQALGTSLFPYFHTQILTQPAQCQLFQDQQTHLIRTYIRYYPHAVRRAVPLQSKHHDFQIHQRRWRTPFCHAIAAGLTWNNYFSDTKDVSTLGSLANVAPEALESRDTLTGLYPFMLAATIIVQPPNQHRINHPSNHHCRRHYQTEQNKLLNLAQLDTVYNLLLRCPQLVSTPKGFGTSKTL